MSQPTAHEVANVLLMTKGDIKATAKLLKEVMASAPPLKKRRVIRTPENSDASDTAEGSYESPDDSVPLENVPGAVDLGHPEEIDFDRQARVMSEFDPPRNIFQELRLAEKRKQIFAKDFKRYGIDDSEIPASFKTSNMKEVIRRRRNKSRNSNLPGYSQTQYDTMMTKSIVQDMQRDTRRAQERQFQIQQAQQQQRLLVHRDNIWQNLIREVDGYHNHVQIPLAELQKVIYQTGQYQREFKDEDEEKFLKNAIMVYSMLQPFKTDLGKIESNYEQGTEAHKEEAEALWDAITEQINIYLQEMTRRSGPEYDDFIVLRQFYGREISSGDTTENIQKVALSSNWTEVPSDDPIVIAKRVAGNIVHTRPKAAVSSKAVVPKVVVPKRAAKRSHVPKKKAAWGARPKVEHKLFRKNRAMMKAANVEVARRFAVSEELREREEEAERVAALFREVDRAKAVREQQAVRVKREYPREDVYPDSPGELSGNESDNRQGDFTRETIGGQETWVLDSD